jgi:hypothetical protein
MMSCRWPKNVIVVNPKPAPPAPPFEILPIGRPVPTDGPNERLSDRVFTCLYRADRSGSPAHSPERETTGQRPVPIARDTPTSGSRVTGEVSEALTIEL